MAFLASAAWTAVRARLRELSGEHGAVATEYASLVIFIAVAVIVGLVVFAAAVNALFGQGADALP
jgi:Flp pilus assembly pilin Flp